MDWSWIGSGLWGEAFHGNPSAVVAGSPAIAASPLPELLPLRHMQLQGLDVIERCREVVELHSGMLDKTESIVRESRQKDLEAKRITSEHVFSCIPQDNDMT